MRPMRAEDTTNQRRSMIGKQRWHVVSRSVGTIYCKRCLNDVVACRRTGGMIARGRRCGGSDWCRWWCDVLKQSLRDVPAGLAITRWPACGAHVEVPCCRSRKTATGREVGILVGAENRAAAEYVIRARRSRAARWQVRDRTGCARCDRTCFATHRKRSSAVASDRALRPRGRKAESDGIRRG